MSDVWEQKYSVPSEDATLDYNGNGLTNLQKSLLGLDPRDSNAQFQISLSIDSEQNQLRLSFDTQFGKLYQLESSTDLLNWASFGDLITGSGGSFETTAEKPPASQIFYRCRFAGDLDADGDGLSGWEEQELGTDDNNLDSDGDGISDPQEYQSGTDPGDFYNGATPLIEIVGGDNQQSDPETFVPEALVVRVLNADGQPLVNAPVTFTVIQSWGDLALSSGGELQGYTLTSRTDANGNATVFYKFPPLANDTSLIRARAGAWNFFPYVIFTETTTDLPGPGAASELTVVRNDDGTTSLNWQNNSSTATRIVIQRQLSDGGWETIGEVDPGATSFTTSLQGNNFRIATEGRYGERSYSEGNNPASSTRYAIIDLGVNRYPIRVTNSGYVLCQGTPPKRWYQGQFQDLIGGDDPVVIGTSDINEQGVVVGAVLLHHPGTPEPPIGTATNYVDSPGAWYRDANFGTRAAAKWNVPQPGPSPATTTQVNATLLGCAQAFSFSVIDYTNAYGPPYTGTVDPCVALVIDGDQIYGWAIRDYQQREASPDPDGRFPPTHWGSVVSGYNFKSGTGLGDASVVLGPDGFMKQGDEYYIDKMRSGTTIGRTEPAGHATRYFINGLLVDFHPLNLNSHNMALMSVTQPNSYKFFIYDTNTRERVALGIERPLFAYQSPIALYPSALNHRTISVVDASGEPGIKVSPQVIGFEGSGFSDQATIWQEDPNTHQYWMQYLNRLIGEDSGWDLQRARDINDSGMITCNGWYQPKDQNGQPIGNRQWRGCLLLPVELMVDANRDGEMSFEEAAIHDKDGTSEEKPYRFWVNDDDDTERQVIEGGQAGDPTEGEKVPASRPDYQLHQIVSKRNLEDLARLWINLNSLVDAVVSGQIQIGLKWKTVTPETTPAINIYPSADGDGSTGHVTDEAAAQAQISDVFNDAIRDKNNKQTVDTNGTFIFKPDYWNGLSQTNPKKCLLFEGVSEGKGELELVFLDPSGNQIGEGGGVWLELKNIKKMYQRSSATPDPLTPLPYNSASSTFDETEINYTPDVSPRFEKPTEEDPQCLVFVHGWRMSYEDSVSFSETMFKRLWWQGYKGRFAAFRWATQTSFHSYNTSEWIAWKYGKSLANYVENYLKHQMPSYTMNIAAHSMGNIVTGSALKRGMTVNNYMLMQAAVPSGCYDDRVNDYGRFINEEDTRPTPDTDVQKGYRLLLQPVSNNVGKFTSFFNIDDYALATGITTLGFWPLEFETNWEKNEIDYKPDVLSTGHYSYDGVATSYFVNTNSPDRVVSDIHECLSFVARPRSKAAGAEVHNATVFGSVMNLEGSCNFGADFGDHGGQFMRPIQQLEAFYERVFNELKQ